MRQLTLLVRPSYAMFGLIALVMFYFALRVSWDASIRFGVVSCSTDPPGHAAFGLTNTTARQVLYRVSRPQFKCDGVWTEFLPPAEYVWMGAGQPLLEAPQNNLNIFSFCAW